MKQRSQKRRLLSVLLGLVLIPVSVLPFVLLAPRVLEGHDSFSQLWNGRSKEDAPPTGLDRAGYAQFKPPGTFRYAVPVLAYQGISEDPKDGLTITPEQFTQQIAMLHRAGFNAISAEQYARHPGGSARDLPSRPILITFDDGRLDSYKHADKVLDRYGMRATMFVITGNIDEHTPKSLKWGELRGMQRSGRWDVQLHAARLHTTVQANAFGDPGAAYTNREWSSDKPESWDSYTGRVTKDVSEGVRRLRQELDVPPLLFAMPYEAPGDPSTNDKRIPEFLDELLHERFEQVFISGRPKTPPRTAQRTPRRYQVRSDTNAESLWRWLSIDPRTAEQKRAQERANRKESD